jgi:hypothetical protein
LNQARSAFGTLGGFDMKVLAWVVGIAAAGLVVRWVYVYCFMSEISK